jgi:tetratricopeptide (TPR) repeat protein
MAQESNSRFVAAALLLAAGVMVSVSLGIVFFLDRGAVTASVEPVAQRSTSADSPSETVNTPRDSSAQKRSGSTVLNVCEADVRSLESAVTFLESCDRPTSAIALKNKGRALLIDWDLEASQAQQAQRLEQAKKSFNQAIDLMPEDPELAFYEAFTEDFEAFVLSKSAGKPVDCVPVKERYAKALRLYAQVNEITPESYNVSIISELGHFLINRDRDYAGAEALYNKVSLSHEDFGDILTSKATAQLLSKDLVSAKNTFERALAFNPDNYQVKYRLGSLWAQMNNSDEALKYYEDLTSNPNTSGFYYAWRDQGILYYFLGRQQEAAQSINEALSFKGAKSFDKENYTLMQNLANCLKTADGEASGSCSENSPGNSPEAALATLKKDGIFRGSIITHNRGADSDPFFAVEHHAFHQCRLF